ncbi:MAG: HAD family hydrolase [Usitatibacter sp.]
MARYTGPIRLVILDIAGTVCDGPQDLRHIYPNDDGLAVKGPVIVFESMFRQYGMEVDWATIRRPMGKFKKEHLREILQIPEVGAQFEAVHKRPWADSDVDAMFDKFRPEMAKVAVTEDLIRPFEGVREAIDTFRAAGILVGCDTGYSKEACSAIYATLERKHGIHFDVVADSENVRGRPTPFLVYDCMYKANVYPPAAVVKADDIRAGVQEGANSGAWTVGLYATGMHDFETLQLAGADYLVPGVRDLPGLVFQVIQPRLMRGGMPGELSTPTPPDQADRSIGINVAPGSAPVRSRDVKAPAASGKAEVPGS